MKKLEQYVYKNQKKLRCGYTTGSCAAAAAKAAAQVLLSKQPLQTVSLMTPKGIELTLDLEEVIYGTDEVSCAIKKDSGDDPDITNGILVYATVTLTKQPGIWIDGGVGVGRVTKSGLQQPIGAAAINQTPRKMIAQELEAIAKQWHLDGGFRVIISIPQGEEIAVKTFNPKLGIEGGISVLGTSGIVEPMSEQALIDSIRVEMKQLAENGTEYLLVTPGNYGETFIKKQLKISLTNSIKCSNYIGEMLDCALTLKQKGILLIGHIGKLIKLAGGIMNTHSRHADCRMEILTAYAALAGAEQSLLIKLINCVTTDEAIAYLQQENLLQTVMQWVMERIELQVSQRVYHKLKVGVIVFSNEYGILGQTATVPDLIKHFERN